MIGMGLLGIFESIYLYLDHNRTPMRHLTHNPKFIQLGLASRC